MLYIALTAALAIVLSLAKLMVWHPAMHLIAAAAWGVCMFTVHNRVSLRRGYTVATSLAFLVGLMGGLYGFAIGMGLILTVGLVVGVRRSRQKIQPEWPVLNAGDYRHDGKPFKARYTNLD